MMKMKDKLSITISILALLLSTITLISDWSVAAQANARKQQSDIYNAYQLGQSVVVIYAYEKARPSNPSPDDQAESKSADFQVSLWSFKAQGYSEYFKLTAERFQQFLQQMKESDPARVSGTFEELNSNIQVASDHRAVAAYDLGWQMMLFGIESAANSSTHIVADYGTVRDSLNADFKEIGVRFAFPQTISSADQFVTAVKAAKGALDKLQP